MKNKKLLYYSMCLSLNTIAMNEGNQANIPSTTVNASGVPDNVAPQPQTPVSLDQLMAMMVSMQKSHVDGIITERAKQNATIEGLLAELAKQNAESVAERCIMEIGLVSKRSQAKSGA